MNISVKMDWHKVIFALMLGFILIAGIYDFLTKDVVIHLDGKTQQVRTSSKNVEELLQEKGIIVSKKDNINIKPNERLKDGMQIRIRRAFKINFVDSNESKVYETSAKNVKAFLEENNIKVSKLDRISKNLKSTIKADDTLTIIRVKEEIQKIRQQVPYQIKTIQDANLDIGQKVTFKEGQAGLKEISYKVTIENGQPLKKDILSETILSNPQDKVVKIGTRQMLVSSRGSYKFRHVLDMSATAYTSSFKDTGKRPGDRGFGVTRSGTKARVGVIAVDPRIIPLGTKVYIESPHINMVAIAEDTGGAIKGNKIDIYMNDQSTVDRFGRKKVRVYVLE